MLSEFIISFLERYKHPWKHLVAYLRPSNSSMFCVAEKWADDIRMIALPIDAIEHWM